MLEEKYIKRFGKEQAECIKAAAIEHRTTLFRPNGWDEGNDAFASAIFVCIGFECVEKYAKYHKINVSWEDFLQFCKEHKKELKEYTGDFDALGLVCGVYDFINEEE